MLGEQKSPHTQWPCPSRSAAEWAVPGPQQSHGDTAELKTHGRPCILSKALTRHRQFKHRSSCFIFNLQKRPQNNNNKPSRAGGVGLGPPQGLAVTLSLSGREIRGLPGDCPSPLEQGSEGCYRHPTGHPGAVLPPDLFIHPLQAPTCLTDG